MSWAHAARVVTEARAEVTASLGGTTFDPSKLPIASPWSTGDLVRILAADWAGVDAPDATRSAAMKLPAISRARNLVVSTLSNVPLVTTERGVPLPDAAPWLFSSGGGLSWQLRQAWTVDDLMFSGWSCWWREGGNQITEVGRIPLEDWEITPDAVVKVDGITVKPDQVIVFPGLHEGILSFGKEVLEDTRTLYRNVRARLFAPSPQLDLHQTGGDQLTDDEIDALIARWAKARQGQLGGVSYTSEHIEVNELGGGGDAQLLIEARNAAAVDCARLVGVHAGMIDATAPKASLNYETTTGRNQEFVDLDLALYMTPVSARLSLDDVSPKGRAISWDTAQLTGLTPSPTGPNLED